MFVEKLIVIEGTTASGKSDLGVLLAERLQGEIVSADSRQVFRGLDIGSGKITKAEMRGVPHHLLDVADPGDFFSAADFQRLAYPAIDGILARGHVPFLVGGTGLYIDAVADGFLFSEKKPDLAYRAELDRLSTPELAQLLRQTLPDWEVDEKNRNRVMRVLEKYHDGDIDQPGKAPRYEVLRLGVTWDRDEVRRRIDERLERRFASGMTEEIRALLSSGVSAQFLESLGLEYRFITQYVTGQIESFEEMKSLLATAIKQFARRQMVWFRRHRDVIWLDMAADPLREAEEAVRGFLEG